MGFFLLYEGMLDSVLFARDRFLKPDGLLFPDKAKLYMAPVDDNVYKEMKFSFFAQNKYGIKMDCIRDEMVQEARVNKMNDSFILSKETSATILDIDL